jgi:hypothetical protein
MDQPTMAQMLQHGMPGTPGGPVQESPTMKNLRLAQLATGVGSQGLGAATVYAGTHLPAPAAFLPMLSGATIGAVGNRMAGNALEPNIRDVWADQLRMKLQGN